jgi:thiol-disulfide isomerase/thioredoxin
MTEKDTILACPRNTRSPRNFCLSLRIINLMLLRVFLPLLLLLQVAHAGIIDDVRVAAAQGNFTAAEAAAQAYKAQRGATPEYAEAVSWLGRFALNAGQPDSANKYARQAQLVVVQILKTRRLDSDLHLPTALGAAFEVQAQAMAEQGHRAQAVALLRDALARYGATSIRSRLQKNLNLLNLVGRPAPALQIDHYLGGKPRPLAQMKGSPVLLFFWAHWCGDCKFEGPIITRLRSDYAFRGLQVIAPTQLYGYTPQLETAPPNVELAWIDKVRQHFYGGLIDVAAPVSTRNFDIYGASTTPTIVLLDRKGIVSLYHPGVMSYEDLRAAVEKVIAP